MRWKLYQTTINLFFEYQWPSETEQLDQSLSTTFLKLLFIIENLWVIIRVSCLPTVVLMSPFLSKSMGRLSGVRRSTNSKNQPVNNYLNPTTSTATIWPKFYHNFVVKLWQLSQPNNNHNNNNKTTKTEVGLRLSNRWEPAPTTHHKLKTTW